MAHLFSQPEFIKHLMCAHIIFKKCYQACGFKYQISGLDDECCETKVRGQDALSFEMKHA